MATELEKGVLAFVRNCMAPYLVEGKEAMSHNDDHLTLTTPSGRFRIVVEEDET